MEPLNESLTESGPVHQLRRTGRRQVICLLHGAHRWFAQLSPGCLCHLAAHFRRDLGKGRKRVRSRPGDHRADDRSRNPSYPGVSVDQAHDHLAPWQPRSQAATPSKLQACHSASGCRLGLPGGRSGCSAIQRSTSARSQMAPALITACGSGKSGRCAMA